MASIIPRPGKHFWLQLRVLDHRHTIRLGRTTRANAESLKVRIEALAFAVNNSLTPDVNTAQWLANIDPVLRKRMAAAGLCERHGRRLDVTLGEFVTAFLADYTAGTPGTKTTIDVAMNRLLKHFGPATVMRAITAEKAAECITTLLSDGLAIATASTTVKKARQLWKHALARSIVTENVWLTVPMGSQENESRGVHVPKAAIAKVLAACPDVEFRLIIALSRFAGLRCPSEHLKLTVGDVDWPRGRFRVHGKGGKTRWVPIFVELRPYLKAAMDKSPTVNGSAPLIVARAGVTGQAWRKPLLQWIASAGIKEPWPRLWHNLRASCETDLVAAGHPMHVVGKWLGHTEAIARRHYLQVTEEEFEKASGDIKAPNLKAQRKAK